MKRDVKWAVYYIQFLMFLKVVVWNVKCHNAMCLVGQVQNYNINKQTWIWSTRLFSYNNLPSSWNNETVQDVWKHYRDCIFPSRAADSDSCIHCKLCCSVHGVPKSPHCCLQPGPGHVPVSCGRCLWNRRPANRGRWMAVFAAQINLDSIIQSNTHCR